MHKHFGMVLPLLASACATHEQPDGKDANSRPDTGGGTDSTIPTGADTDTGEHDDTAATNDTAATDDTGDSGSTEPAPLLLYVNEDVSDVVRSEVYPSIGAQDAFIVYQSQFDADADSVPDTGAAAAVAAYLDGVAPVGTTAPVCIDWEAGTMSTLSTGDVDSDAFRSAVVSFVDFIADVRALRPDLRFGYYGLPVRSYWSRDAAWHARNDALLPIIDASDVVFASVYDFYTEAEVGEAEDLAYVRDNVGEALRLAAGKDVFPYAWHRYHDSNTTVGGMLIGEEEFKAHVGAVFEAEFEGARAAGVVWWGADRYFVASGTEPWVEVFAEELPVDTDVDAYLDAVHTERLRWLREILDAAMADPGER
jgi:hypothetical protein